MDKRFASVGTVVTVVICGVAALFVLLTNRPASAERTTVVLIPMQHAVSVQNASGQSVVQQPAQAAPARMGRWTPQLGVAIARRGLQWVGWPYSFGAGGQYGPSYGLAVDKDSRHDGKVYGFDCSGLTMFALAPWRGLTHFAATQYTEVGSFHPALNQLQPGDLIFWSPDDTIGHIGHVAIYVGNGNVVQAPHSGARITLTPLYNVESGYIGATRPLT